MISKKQRIHLMADCWNPACRAQGWKVSDRAFRLAKFGEILGRELASSDDIEAKREFDVLKGALLTLADRVVISDAADGRRRLLWSVEHYFKPCLGVYVTNVEGYVATVLKDRFRIVKGLNSIDDLSSHPRLVNGVEKPSELQMAIFTLAGRLQAFRKESGDSVVEMKVKAGLTDHPNAPVIETDESEVPINAEGVAVPF